MPSGTVLVMHAPFLIRTPPRPWKVLGSASIYRQELRQARIDVSGQVEKLQIELSGEGDLFRPAEFRTQGGMTEVDNAGEPRPSPTGSH